MEICDAVCLKIKEAATGRAHVNSVREESFFEPVQ